MKLTTKRNRWYFFRELFLYLIPMILIVWSIDIFVSFIKCPLHPEFSAPCSVNWILAIMYWIFLIIAIIFAIVSNKNLKNIKKKIENEFMESIHEKDFLKDDCLIGDMKKNNQLKKNINKKTHWSLDDIMGNEWKNEKIIIEWNNSLKEKSWTNKIKKKVNKAGKTSARKKVTKK